MESNADVLIIGGGPAGSTLACLLAAGNHDAVIVEKAVHPRAHVGELLTPSVNSVLHRIGLLNQMDAAGFVRRYAVAWSAPGVIEKRTMLIPVAEHPPPRALRRYGFNVERDAFDAMLLQRARQLGVRVMERTVVRRVLFEDDRATGVELQNARGEVDPMGGTTGSLFMIGRRVGSVSITPLAALVAAVVAVGMWATRERRPSAASCPRRYRPAVR